MPYSAAATSTVMRGATPAAWAASTNWVAKASSLGLFAVARIRTRSSNNAAASPATANVRHRNAA